MQPISCKLCWIGQASISLRPYGNPEFASAWGGCQPVLHRRIAHDYVEELDTLMTTSRALERGALADDISHL